MWEVLNDYLEEESDCSESNSSYNEHLSDNKPHSEENNDSILTCSEDISLPQLKWILPNTFAANSLPEGLSLRCSDHPNALFGVYATRQIKKDTIFGPYVGTRNFDIQLNNNYDRSWKIFMNNKFHHYIHGEDPENSNWMKYVNDAGHAELQNLESFQYGYKIYYRAIVDIQEDAELLVWYSEDYNQDCLNAGGKLKELILDNTSLFSFGNKCQNSGHTTSSDKAPTCGINSHNAATINKRTHTKAFTGLKQYKCDVCSASFTQNSALRRHKKVHTSKKPCKCDVCNVSFASRTSLITHKRRHTGEKPYKCDVCNSTFAHNTAWTIHKRTHTGEKPFKCDVCKSAFAQSTDLIRHRRIHTGEKPHKCDICNAAFSRSNYMIIHKRTHTGEKPYKCDVCNASFAKNSALRRHTKTHTGEKPLKCDVCNAAYARNYDLKKHKMTHTGEKPYKCDVCISAFSRNSDLKKHKRTHTGEKPYKCDVCQAAFSDKSALIRHTKTHSNKKTHVDKTLH